jgi:hypothetical protein
MGDTLKIAGLLLVATLAVAQIGPPLTPTEGMSGPQRSQEIAQSSAPQTPSTTTQNPNPKPKSQVNQETPPLKPKEGLNGAPAAKSPGTKTSATAGWKKYCAPEGDYCVKYPAGWEMLGDTADSGGIVVAPPQSAKPSEKWSSIAAAATDLPPQPAGKERPSFDELIGVVLDSMRPGVQAQTLERKQMSVEGMPAQVLKLKYDDENGQTWIEEIALMDGDEAIYSIALRCTPDELAKLEPVFKEMVGSWRLVEPAE